MKYIDAHTHLPDSGDERIFIHNPSETLDLNQKYYCVGLHPWFIKSSKYHTVEKMIQDFHLSSAFIGIGEIGLDKKIDTDFELQKNIFHKQVELAIKLNINRLIIHSVRAYTEILELLIKSNYRGKLLLHDFYASPESFKQYSNHFDSYASLGKKLFSNEKAQKLLSALPLNKILLETDDQTDYTIQMIYEQAGRITGQEISALSTLLESNFSNFIDLA